VAKKMGKCNMKNYTALGKRVQRADATAKVTGEAKYVADIVLPRMLYGKILWSNCPHAIIRNIDASLAEKMQGVRGVAILKKIGDKVRYHGEAVAAVAGDDLYIAEEALKLIKVDYEELPAVFDTLEAMKPDAPLVHDNNIGNVSAKANHNYGDVEEGFKQADHIYEDTFKIGMGYQGYMETHGAVAQVDASGEVTVWTSTQGHFGTQSGLSHIFGIPASKIRVIAPEIGGAFGGKTAMSVEPACVALAQKTRQPIKIILTRHEDFISSHPGPACIANVKIGVKNDGTLTAMEVNQIWDAGAYGGVFVGSFPRTRGLYKIPNLKVDVVSIFTNKLAPGAYRGPAAPEMTFPIESLMDEIASDMGFDPIEFRLKNAVDEGDLDVNRVPYRRIGFKETLRKAQEYLGSSNFNVEKSSKIPLNPPLIKGEIDHPLLENNISIPPLENNAIIPPLEKGGRGDLKTHLTKGIGIACGKWINGVGTSGVDLKLNADGRISMITGSVDLTGVKTVFAQMTAEELDISVDMIDVGLGDTLTALPASLTGGSRTTYALGSAIKLACEDFKKQLLNSASQILGEDIDKLEYSKGKVFIRGTSQNTTLQEIGATSIHTGAVVGKGVTSTSEWLCADPSFITQIAEVEVNKESGEVKLLKFVCIQDVGQAANPLSLEGQIQGGAAQGMGWAIMEKMIFHDGVLLNPGFMDYAMPTSIDIPPIEPVIVEVPSSNGPYGVRGSAEMPMIPVLAAVANAIHSATGVRLKEIPITREKIIKELR
jgi:xanthine dehydrogenase molybdenum-binding subunit